MADTKPANSAGYDPAKGSHGAPAGHGSPGHAHGSDSYEHTDILTKPLYIAGVVLVVFFVLMIIGMNFVFDWFKADSETANVQASSIREPLPDVPGPRLQGVQGFHDNTDTEDMATQRKADKVALESYGPGSEGRVRIPIERAMALIVEKNLLKASQPATGPTTAATTKSAAAADTPSTTTPTPVTAPTTAPLEADAPASDHSVEPPQPTDESENAAESKEQIQ